MTIQTNAPSEGRETIIQDASGGWWFLNVENVRIGPFFSEALVRMMQASYVKNLAYLENVKKGWKK